jgi:PAS domain S-box-containing protein
VDELFLHAAVDLRVRSEHDYLKEAHMNWSQIALASIGDAVIVTNGDGHVAFMNPVAQAMTGWNDEALGKELPEVFHLVNEMTRLAVENPFARLTREGAVAGMANHSILIRKDGTEVPIDDGGAPIRNDSGTVEGVVLVFRDITQRKRTERLGKRRGRQRRGRISTFHFLGI